MFSETGTRSFYCSQMMSTNLLQYDIKPTLQKIPVVFKEK